MNENQTKILNLFNNKNEIYLIVVFFFFILAVLLFTFFFPNKLVTKKNIEFEIKRGSTLEEIIDTLYSKKIIPNKLNLRIAIFLSGTEKKIKAGDYVIDKSLSYFQLIDILTGNKVVMQKKVTIPEGIEQPELASILKRELGIDSVQIIELSRSKSFIRSLGIDADNLEGYLLPETYYFMNSSGPLGILRRLTEEMIKFLADKQKRMTELKMTENEVLTLASIVDGESNNFNEFKVISGVYHNRLKKGMALQADPTINFIIRNRKDRSIHKKDLEINSKYNTYKNTGLPPTPINNPGKQAILAALFPEKNNYLYFVANGNGSHLFASNYEQHSTNVSKYRRWLRNLK